MPIANNVNRHWADISFFRRAAVNQNEAIPNDWQMVAQMDSFEETKWRPIPWLRMLIRSDIDFDAIRMEERIKMNFKPEMSRRRDGQSITHKSDIIRVKLPDSNASSLLLYLVFPLHNWLLVAVWNTDCTAIRLRNTEKIHEIRQKHKLSADRYWMAQKLWRHHPLCCAVTLGAQCVVKLCLYEQKPPEIWCGTMAWIEYDRLLVCVCAHNFQSHSS